MIEPVSASQIPCYQGPKTDIFPVNFVSMWNSNLGSKREFLPPVENCLIFEDNSLLCPQKFPIPLRREFRFKPLNLLAPANVGWRFDKNQMIAAPAPPRPRRGFPILKLRLDAEQFRMYPSVGSGLSAKSKGMSGYASPTLAQEIPEKDWTPWLRRGTVLSQVLALCWVPRRLCARWFKARHIDAPPWLAATPSHSEPMRTLGSNTLGTRETVSSPSRASEHQIHNAIAIVYSEHATAGSKPPNVKQLVPLVKAQLGKNGYDATYEQIQLHGADPRHAAKRRRPGRTVRSELMSSRASSQVR
jgi:hypothetical protein